MGFRRAAMVEDFSAIYQRHGAAIHAFLARLTGDSAAAEDLCQDTFLRYLEHERALAGRNGHVSPWLFRVASNLGIDWLRRKRPLLLASGALPDRALPIDAPVSGPDESDEVERVRRAVTALEPGLRAAFLLRAHHGLTFVQLATVLALSERGAKDRYRRARDELARQLDPPSAELNP